MSNLLDQPAHYLRAAESVAIFTGLTGPFETRADNCCRSWWSKYILGENRGAQRPLPMQEFIMFIRKTRTPKNDTQPSARCPQRSLPLYTGSLPCQRPDYHTVCQEEPGGVWTYQSIREDHFAGNAGRHIDAVGGAMGGAIVGKTFRIRCRKNKEHDPWRKNPGNCPRS